MRRSPAASPDWVRELDRPCLLLDPARAAHNLARMQHRARSAGRPLRVHMKTIQSTALAQQLGLSPASGIAVSSLAMARYFLEAGWSDLLIAVPLNPGWLPEVQRMNRTARVAVTLADGAVLAHLSSLGDHTPVPVWVEVDAGYGRSGIPWHRTGELLEVCGRLGVLPGCRPRGLLCHAGNSYSARGAEAVQRVADLTRERLTGCRAQLSGSGLGLWPISFGDTPCCSLASGLEEFDEWRPGNFLLHDLSQLEIGSCGEDGPALAVLCPVLSVRAGEGRAILHGGAVHLSREGLELDTPEGRTTVFGQLVEAGAEGLGSRIAGAYLSRLSQEHGELRAPPELLSALEPGQVLAVLPVHSCLAADLHREYRLPDGSRIPRACCL